MHVAAPHGKEINMAEPPMSNPSYRRYWGAYNRPFAGAGCLFTLLLFLLLWFLLSLLFDALVIW